MHFRRKRLARQYSAALCTALVVIVFMNRSDADLRVPGVRNRKNFGFVRQGDVNLGQLVGFTSGRNCSAFSSSGVVYSKALQFAIGQINNRVDLLPNVTVGFVQMDDCRDPSAVLEAAMYLTGDSDDGFNETLCSPLTWNSTDGYSYPRSFDVAAVVGPSVSNLLASVAPVLGAFHIPTAGIYATVNTVSDKTLYPFVIRMVPPDLVEERALLEIARYMGWTYISMVYSAGAYGEGAFNDIASMLRTTAASYGICLAVTVRIPSAATSADYDYVVDQLTSDPAARVVIAYLQTSPSADIPELFSAVQRGVGAGWFLWLGSDSITGKSSSTYADVLEGSIYVTNPPGVPIPGFQQFFESLPWNGMDTLDTNPRKVCNENDYWFQQFWRLQTGCNTTAKCQLWTSLKSSRNPISYGWALTSRIYDATNVYALALHATIDQHCPQVFDGDRQKDGKLLRDCVRGDALMKNLLKTKMTGVMGDIAFDSNGDLIGQLYINQYQTSSQSSGGSGTTSYVEVTIGTLAAGSMLPSMNQTAVRWTSFITNGTTISTGRDRGQIQSVCGTPCRADEYVVQLSVSCCWRCDTCRVNEIVNANGTGCVACPPFTWPTVLNPALTRNRSIPSVLTMTCEPIAPAVLTPSDPVAGALLAMAIVCAAITLTMAVIYLVKRNHRLIKATCRESSWIILSGSLLASATVISYVLWPIDALCTFRNVGFHVSTNLLYAPLLVKTVRIYRIFATAQSSVRMPSYVSGAAQLIMTAGLVAVQIVLSVISELVDGSTASLLQPTSFVNYVELQCCQSNAWFLIQLSYNIAIMIVCAVLGFKARRLPENFNDSQFIFVSVATTLFVWILFIPAYFTAYYAYLRSAITGFCLVSNVIVTLVCQFVRIAYAVFFVPSDNIMFSMKADGATNSQVTPASASVPSRFLKLTKSSITLNPSNVN